MPEDMQPQTRSSLGKLFEAVEEKEVSELEKSNSFSDEDTLPVSDLGSSEENSVARSGSDSSLDSSNIERSASDGSIASNKTRSSFDTEKLAKSIAMLKAISNFVFDEREIPEEEKSQARRNDEERYDYLKDSVNDVITQYDKRISKYGSNLEKYQNFIQTNDLKSFDNQITKEKIQELKESLEPEERAGFLTRNALKARRAVAEFGAGFFVKEKDIAQYNKLSKAEKEKIKLVKKLVDLEDDQSLSLDQKQAVYQEVNNSIKAINRQQKSREKRDAFRIIARQMHRGKLFTQETASLFKDKALHPYTKITENPEYGTAEKAARVTAKLAEKTAQAGVKIVKKGAGTILETGQYLIRNTVKQPLATVYRGSMAMTNAIEFLTLEAKILSEQDPDIKQSLREQAEIKFQNMGYEGEKFLRAAAATAGIALLDAAAISSFGVAPLPMAGGVMASEKFFHAVLMSSQIVDHIQTSRDGIAKVEEQINEIEEKKKHLTKEEKRVNPRRNALQPEERGPDVEVKKRAGSIREYLQRRDSTSSVFSMRSSKKSRTEITH